LNRDQIRGFSFDSAPIHGRIVNLAHVWQTIRTRHSYAPSTEQALGEMVATVAMLAQGIKLDGSVILQIRGDGRIRTAMAECTNRTTLRALAHTASHATNARAARDGQLAITLKPHRGQMYQGIVPLETDSVRRAVEHYFETSEQLPTRIWIAGDRECVAGLLLQRLPGHAKHFDPFDQADASWGRLQQSADLLTREELLTLSAEQLLLRAFAGESVRLQQPIELAFGCSCSRERTANALRVLGRTEIDEILAQEGRIDMTCEFCGETYGYDSIDARLIFEPLATEPPATPL
jgi:molecular chaperone Hsp33